MSLRLGYKTAPDVQKLRRPPIWSAREDVVWQDVVVPESRYYGYREAVGPLAVAALSKDVRKLGDHVLVLLHDLLLRPRDLVIVVVSRRVAGPYNKVYIVFDVVFYPLERLVDERKRGVASCGFCAIEASGSAFAMARSVGFCARICLVERVWVKVCGMTLVAISAPGIKWPTYP